MLRRPPRSTRTDTLFPYTTLFRSDGKAIAAGRRAIGKLVQEDEVALPLARPDMMQGQRVEPFGKPRQFMIMGGEQAARAAHVVDRLKHRPGDRQSVIGGRAAPDLVKDHERSRSRLGEDGGRSEERRVGKECVSRWRSRW